MTTNRRWSCAGFGFARVAGLITVCAGVTLLASASAAGTPRTAVTCGAPSATARAWTELCPSVGADVAQHLAIDPDDPSGHRAPASIVNKALVAVHTVQLRRQHTSGESCVTQTQNPLALRGPPAFDSDPSDDDTDDEDGSDSGALVPAGVTLVRIAGHCRVALVLIAAAVHTPADVSLLRGPPPVSPLR